MYQITRTPGVIRLSDGASIPEDKGNRDWCEYQAWLSDGNQPSPPPEPPPPVVPRTVSSGDFMRALIELGWYGSVLSVVNGMDVNTPDGLLAKVLWQRASIIERFHPMLVQIARAIGKTDADLDRLFLLAGTY